VEYGLPVRTDKIELANVDPGSLTQFEYGVGIKTPQQEIKLAYSLCAQRLAGSNV
jgi:hypothetical protein